MKWIFPFSFQIEVKEGRLIRSSFIPSLKQGLIVIGNPTSSEKGRLIEFMEAYQEGEPAAALPLPIHPHLLTPFNQSVLTTLQAIPFGEQWTYQMVAEKVGSPLAARAIGGACSKNPLPFLIPCHRVVRKNSLGGFTPWIEIKKFLIDFENGF